MIGYIEFLAGLISQLFPFPLIVLQTLGQFGVISQTFFGHIQHIAILIGDQLVEVLHCVALNVSLLPKLASFCCGFGLLRRLACVVATLPLLLV